MQNSEESTEKNTASKIDVNKTICLLLFDAAMGYREGFYREDIEAIEKIYTNQLKEVGQNAKPGTSGYRKAQQKVKGFVLDKKHREETFNNTVYGYIDGVLNNLSPEAAKAFDNMRTVYGLIAEEVYKAKDRTKLLTVAQLYNEGVLDYLFENNEKDSNNNGDGLADSERLPKEQHSAGESIEQSSNEQCVRHEQVGPVQDGVGDNPSGYGNDILP